MKRTLPKLSQERVALISILLIAAFLRLWRIRDYMTFLGDEGRDVLIVRRMLVDFDIPFIGPTASVGGFFLGPMYYYFMAPFLALFNFDPVGPAVMVALFGVATVYLIYHVGKQWFSAQTGLIAAFLYTISPLVIAQSRSSWNPNIVPFFSLLLMYVVWMAVQKKTVRWYLLFGALAGIGIQLHYVFAFLAPVVVIFVLLYDRSVESIKRYLTAIAGFFTLLIPFLGFEVKNNFLNIRLLFSYVFGSDEVMYSDGNIVSIFSELLFRLYARLVYYFPPLEQIEFMDDRLIGRWTLLVWIGIILSFGLFVFRTLRKTRPEYVLIWLWLLFGLGLFTLLHVDIYDYYFVIIFTVPFLLTASVIANIWEKKHSISQIGAGIMLFGLVMLNLRGYPFQYGANKQVTQIEEISSIVYEQADGKPYNFALLTLGNSDHAYRYFLEVWGNPPVTIENFKKDPDRTTVADQLFVICEYKDCEPVGNPLWEIAGFGQADIAGSWEHPHVMVYQLVAYEDEVVQ